jgi:hypothetical protein
VKIIETPVAIFIYNRPEHTEKLIKAISGFQFKNLIFIADGPKTLADQTNCLRARELVIKDWGCHVDYVMSDINLGCRNRVVTGLDFVFKNYESAIILEDDCIPTPSFFDFCEMALIRYEKNHEILMACGTVLVEPRNYEYSYFFSRIPHIWGWATWRDRWHKYPRRIGDYQKLYKLEEQKGYIPKPFVWSLCDNLRKIEAGELDTWDYQMTYLGLSQKLLSVFPSKNLISNIGFDKNATHTKRISILSNLYAGKIDDNMRHPPIASALIANDLERMLLEGYAGRKWYRLFKILMRKNGFLHATDRAIQKIRINL